METQLTFNEDDDTYWLSREREPHDGEGHSPVTVEFDSVYDFAKALSENEGAKEYFKSTLSEEKERIKYVINNNGSIRKALELYVKYMTKEVEDYMTEEDEDCPNVLDDLDPFAYINYLFHMTNDKEILDKYSYYFTTDENGKIAYSQPMDTFIDDFAKRYLNNEEYEQFISDNSIGTDLWFKYHEALIQEALDFEIK